MEIKDTLLTDRQNICKKALNTLHNSIVLLKSVNAKSSPGEYLAFQDSVIKRFEFSLDVVWQYLKLYMSEKFGSNVKSPKETFKEAFKQGLLNSQDTEMALKMVDDRNDTSHLYDSAIAREIGQIIPKYYELLNHLLKTAKI